jgi:hypothetical protein
MEKVFVALCTGEEESAKCGVFAPKLIEEPGFKLASQCKSEVIDTTMVSGFVSATFPWFLCRITIYNLGKIANKN